ncbi:MAG: BMC domain-containing protein [Ignavibacterium sp.]|jgi:microcompartment protein CcmL/EutN|nr:BMC domain-containing protein [Ignavibacterium sp.]
MSNSIGLIESKGLVALVEAADVILKNSPVTVLGIHKLENGLVTLAVSGNTDYVKAAIESGTEAGRRVGEIYASSVVDNPGKELLNIFSELFPNGEILNSHETNIESVRVLSKDKGLEESTKLFASIPKQAKPESKREKSKPLQVTKITPIHNPKKIEDQLDSQSGINPDVSFGSKIEIKKNKVEENNDILDSTKPLSTIERLRIEALGSQGKKNKLKELSVPEKKKNDEPKNNHPIIENRVIDFEAISHMNVHKLRHYARGFPNFPIKGREISRANRNELVDLFKTIKPN